MSDSQEWNGRNRRTSEDRRQQPDRREEIRFEPGKKDRRQNRGRRIEDRDMWEDAMKDE